MNAGAVQRSTACDELGAQLGRDGAAIDDLGGHGTRFRAPRKATLERVHCSRFLTVPKFASAWTVGCIAAGALVLVILFAIYAQPGAKNSGLGPAALAGSQAQSFALPELGGRTASLQDFRGHLVILNLWASWCPPCRAELPDLQRLYDQLRAHKLVVVGVNEGESAQRAQAFAAALRLHFPILLDENQSYGRVYAALGLPTTIIIDERGTIVRGFDGALTFDQMKAAVQPLLKTVAR
jgi:peroxiredoxin